MSCPGSDPFPQERALTPGSDAHGTGAFGRPFCIPTPLPNHAVVVALHSLPIILQGALAMRGEVALPGSQIESLALLE